MTLLLFIFYKFDGHESVPWWRLSNKPIAAEPLIPVVPFDAHPMKCLLTFPLYEENIGSREGACRRCYSPGGTTQCSLFLCDMLRYSTSQKNVSHRRVVFLRCYTMHVQKLADDVITLRHDLITLQYV